MKGTVITVIVSVVVFSVLLFFTLTFATRASTYIIENPTQEQVIQLAQADPQGRVWFQDATQLYQGSSLIKFVLRTRYWETEKVEQFLDKVGVSYQLVGRGN